MSKRRFTADQIVELLKNSNVKKCSEKSITYSNNFKIKAVKRYEEGRPAVEIFSEAGFDRQLIGMDTPVWCLKEWLVIYRQKGIVGLESEMRGKIGRPRKNRLSGEERIRWLEAENKYLKAENDFLAKLRAKRKE